MCTCRFFSANSTISFFLSGVKTRLGLFSDIVVFKKCCNVRTQVLNQIWRSVCMNWQQQEWVRYGYRWLMCTATRSHKSRVFNWRENSVGQSWALSGLCLNFIGPKYGPIPCCLFLAALDPPVITQACQSQWPSAQPSESIVCDRL